MKRTPLKRKTPLRSSSSLKSTAGKPKPRKRMKQRSSKAAAKQEVRNEVLRALVDERGPWCEVRKDGVCKGECHTGHEKLLRSQGGDPADPANILLVCFACHTYVHANPAESYANGWMTRAGAKGES